MKYECKEAIINHIQASGPQSERGLNQYCRAQCVPHSASLFSSAMAGLVVSGIIVRDEDYFDLSYSYYNALI